MPRPEFRFAIAFMDAFILAAGRGERLMPLTAHVPKPLIRVGALSLIEIHLIRLAQAGFRRIIINLAYRGGQIQAALGDGARYGVEIHYSEEPEGALETAGGIVHALALIRSRQFLLVNADILTDYPFQQLSAAGSIKAGVSEQSANHLVLTRNPAHHPSGDFYLNASGQIEPDALEGRRTYTGIARLDKSLFGALKPGRRALAPVLRAAAQNGQLSGEHYDGEWSDIGTPERLEVVRQNPTTQDWVGALASAVS